MKKPPIVEVARWDCCGQGVIEQDIQEMMTPGSDIVEVSGYDVLDIIAEYPFYSFNNVALDIKETIWPTRAYYIYYKYHPTSGHQSYIQEYYPETNSFQIGIAEPKGGRFPAFWSEVIIFRLK